jgi:hypothetical protein
LGSLIDRLATTNIKQFMVQDKIHFAAAHGLGLDPETTSQIVALNLQRTGLINEINERYGDGEQIVKLVDTGIAKS